MALTKTVTKIWPTKGDRNIFQTGINLILLDDLVEVFNENFTADYPKGSNPDRIKADIIDNAQARIDRYKAERQINNAAAYDQAISDIDNALVL